MQTEILVEAFVQRNRPLSATTIGVTNGSKNAAEHYDTLQRNEFTILIKIDIFIDNNYNRKKGEEKEANEKTNKLIRQYFPRERTFDEISEKNTLHRCKHIKTDQRKD